MRKLLFALAISAGAFTFAAGSPASAMTAGPVTGMSDVVNANSATESVHWRRHHHRHHHRNCWWHHGHRHCRWGW